MLSYQNKSGKSGVEAYEFTRDAIIIRFLGGAVYKYSNSSAGCRNVSKMKALAASGKGLSTFIATKVKDRFELRLK